MSKQKNLRTSLDKEMMEKFEDVKIFLGLSRDAEVVRFLINEYFKKIHHRKNDEG